MHLEASIVLISFGNWLFQLSMGNVHFLYSVYSAFGRVPTFISEVTFMSALSCTGSKTWIFPRWQISEKGCRSAIFLPLKNNHQLHCPMATLFVYQLWCFHSSNPPDATRDNDWTCPKCGNINFSFRTVCNMRKCNTPKPGSQVCTSLFILLGFSNWFLFYFFKLWSKPGSQGVIMHVF